MRDHLPAHDPSEPTAPEVAPVGAALVRLSGDADDGRLQADQLRNLAAALARSARAAGAAAVLRGRWLADVLVEVAPGIPVRDLATLQAQHDGRSGEALADALVAAAARSTGTVGAGGGALAAVQWTTPPALLSAPVQLSAETLAVAVIEIKLLAELHHVYGKASPGPEGRRLLPYAASWAQRRGLDPLDRSSLNNVLGATAKRQLRRRLAGRLGRNLTTMGPLLSGAVAGAVINSRETKRVAEEIRADLRSGRQPS